MKKLIFTLCFISASALMMQVSAQSCGSNGSGACQVTGGPSGGGFQAPNTVPCAEQGVAYSSAMQFAMFSSFNFLGQQDVDSLEFISIENLPCGICWAVNQTDKRYSSNEDGCINLSGTTTDAAGQYKLAISVKAWINGQANGQTIPASLFDQTGVRLYLRVKSNGGTCVAVDTAANSSANLNATQGGCATAINELSSSVSSLSIVPNPMNSEAVFSFMAEKNADYTVRITDVTGKEVSVKQVEGRTGENRVAVERNNLPAGVYFLLLTDGKNVVTKRFSVTD